MPINSLSSMQQDHQQELEQEFERFIEFGQLLDRPTRKYLVRYLQQKITGEVDSSLESLDDLKDDYFQYFRKALDGLFGISGLLDIIQNNPTNAKQIVLDTLYWMRKSYEKARVKNPFEEETTRLGSWSVTPLRVFIKRWNFLIDYLRNVYEEQELPVNFYRDRFKDLIQGKDWDNIPQDNRQKLELILTDLLAQWDALLNAKLLDYQLNKLEEERKNFMQTVEAKVQEYQQLMQLVSPFAEYLGNYWDMSRELWKSTSFDVVKQYDDLLKNEKSIQDLADLLGKMREAEIEMEEETFERTIIRQQWIVDEEAKSEIVGVKESDELSHILSSEVALLSDSDTETLFLKKYADKNLLTFRYEDRKLVKSEDYLTEIHQKVKQREKGPFIICVDTSESMMGRPEQIAKVLCLGILKMAARDNRRAYLINFSIGIETLDLFDISNNLDSIAKFLNMSFYGGTDISLPLYEALRQLQGNDYEDADVLVISDFIMYKIDEDVLQQVRFQQQNKNTQFHSLTLSKEPNPYVLEYFDTNWVYDPKERGIIKSLTEGLKTISERY
ncbi:MAG: VWA domain-containing protein [Bacteroidota bacterium]